MKFLKNLGIVGIISFSIISCAPNKQIYKTLYSKLDSNTAALETKIDNVRSNLDSNRFVQHTKEKIDYVKNLNPKVQKRIDKYYSDPKFMKNLFEHNRDKSEVLYVVKDGLGRVDFVPGAVYGLEECLKGNYIMTAMPSKKGNPRIVMSYFTNNGDIYQQAFFSYDHNFKSLIASMVEKDNNLDGERDMMFHSDTQTGRLQLLRPSKTDSNLTAYVSYSILDSYFACRHIIDKNR
jgi:hypothetical protein